MNRQKKLFTGMMDSWGQPSAKKFSICSTIGGQHKDSFYGVQFNFKLQFLTIFNERPKAAASRQDHKMQFENLVTTRIIGVVLFGLGMSRTKLDRWVIYFFRHKLWQQEEKYTIGKFVCQLHSAPQSKHPVLHIMAVWVVEFSSGGYKIRKTFA